MTEDKLSFNAIGGPSKFDLMLSLFDGNKKPRRTVEFKLEGAREPITVAITMVQQEDGSGESWNFEGTLVSHERGYHLKGHYSSKSRVGHLTLVIPSHQKLEDDVLHPTDQVEVDDYLEWLRGKENGWYRSWTNRAYMRIGSEL